MSRLKLKLKSYVIRGPIISFDQLTLENMKRQTQSSWLAGVQYVKTQIKTKRLRDQRSNYIFDQYRQKLRLSRHSKRGKKNKRALEHKHLSIST